MTSNTTEPLTGPSEARAKAKARRRLWAVGGLAVALGGAAAVFMGTSMADTPSTTYTPAKVDGKRAYGYLQAVCKIGPRPAGSAANTRQRQMVAKHFEAMGGAAREQPFNGTDPLTQQTVSMVNLIGSWSPERTDRVLLGVHYDTRPFPDEDPDPANRKVPFIGANDGASGVALLMEIAHHLKDSQTPYGVDLVLFDGEELVYGGGRNQTGEYFLGSKHFAQEYARARRRVTKGQAHYSAAIILDMVGDKDLTIDKEPHSLDFAPRLVKDIWATAKGLGVKQFRDRIGQVAVNDDHLPLFDAGIPAIDVIDFDYPHWHTAKDLPENCSAESLEAVGKVITAWLNRPKPRR